jgi:hypothetical protein
MKLVKRIKPHLPYLAVFLVIFSVVYGGYFDLNQIAALDSLTFYVAKIEILRQSLTDYGDVFPLWNPYTMGGQPYLAMPDNPQMTSLVGLLIPFLAKPNQIFLVAVLIDMLLAGIFMYILVMYLVKNRKAAFISALVYTFNPWIVTNIAGGGMTTLNVYMLIPLTMMFVVKAFRKERWVFYSVITGILFSLQIRLSTGLKVFLFVALLFGIYIIIYIVGPNFKKRIVKAFFVSLIVASITFGLSAQFVLPEKEFLDMTSRGNLAWEQSGGGTIPIKDWFNNFIEPFYEGWPKIQGHGGGNIGLIPFILAFLAVYAYWKDKKVLAFALGAMLAVLIVSGSFVYYLLWKYVPPFHSFRHIHRAAVLFIFAMSVLVGYGFMALSSILKKKFEKVDVKGNVAFIAVVLLVIVNIILLGVSPYALQIGDISHAIDKNYLMKEIAKDDSIFRIHVYETNGIDWGTEFSYVPYGFGGLYGSTGIWLSEWLNRHLAMSLSEPAKFWGMLNVKYVQSLSNISVDGLRFVEKFEKCQDCYAINNDIQKAFGNYLYENELFLPRAYFVDDSVLVVGQEEARIQTVYGLMMHPGFNPSNTVIIEGRGSINDYGAGDLNKYSAIVLTEGSVDQNSMFTLKNYVDNGGRLFPNLIENKNTITEEDINGLFGSFKGELNAVDDGDYITHTFDRYEVKLNGRKGFFVLSERFSMFPGWNVKADGERLEIVGADGAISSVYVDGDYGSLMFEYKPKSYILGRNITILTLVLVLVYFGYYFYKKKINKEKDNQ